MAGPVVLFETLWAEVSDGWSIAARAYARAMELAGIDVRLRSWAAIMEDPHPSVMAEVGHMLVQPPKLDFYLFSTPLASPQMMGMPLDVLRSMPPPRAFYTMFERTNVQAEIIAQLRQLEGVMVPCSANRDALQGAGLKNVTWVPFPYFDGDPHLGLPPPRKQSRVFYWIGRWEPRKAPDNLIRAFLRAFKPGEAELVLKLGPVPWKPLTKGGKRFPDPEEVIAEEWSNGAGHWSLPAAHAAITVVRGRLSPEEMLLLHARGDVYVSASRGEGIDLPSMAAKLAGRRIVTTDSGGPRDFLGPCDVLVPSNGNVPAPDYEPFWGAGARYADYALDDLVAALQKARSEPLDEACTLPEKFHASSVGLRMREWVEEITSRA